MSASIEVIPASTPTPLFVAEFGCSAEGLLVARVGDNAFAMVPCRDGRHFLATGWRLTRPLATWSRDDFYGHSGDLADEAAFRAVVAENAGHQCERAALGRREVFSRSSTPWGLSQGAMVYGDGVLCHSTAGHGGFQLSGGRNACVHPKLRQAGGFYEEDAEWAAVAQALPDLFTGYERRLAEETIRNHWPDVWEAIHGRTLTSGQSVEWDRQAYERNHAQDWIVIAAIGSEHYPGFVTATSMRGGRREAGGERRCFLVPSTEYEPGRFGFVIDEERHKSLDER